MSFTTCPVATVNTSVDQVWSLLNIPANYDRWWDARTCAIIPEGPAQPGQRILAESTGFGRHWRVSVLIEGVDDSRRQIDLTTSLPFGITLHNHFTCSPVGEAQCRVSFG
jgi:hypothetical protein